MSSVNGATYAPSSDFQLTSTPSPARPGGFQALPDGKAVSALNLQVEMTRGRWENQSRLNESQDIVEFTNMRVVDLPSYGLRNTGSPNEQKPGKLGVGFGLGQSPSSNEPTAAMLKIQFEGSKKSIVLEEITNRGGKGNTVSISDESGSRGYVPGQIGVLREGQKLTVGVLNQGRFESLSSVLQRFGN